MWNATDGIARRARGETAREIVAGRRAALRRAALAAAAVMLTGCGMVPTRSDTAQESALPPAPASPLVKIAQASLPAPGLTGFRLMPLGSYSLDARVELAKRATRSLDLQYYQINNDRTGRLLLRQLRDAALRGVRVRLIVDDLYTSGGDALFVGLAAFPNVEVRLFNAFCCGRESLLAKYTASLRRLRPAQPPDAQQAVHRRQRRRRGRRTQHRGRILHAQHDRQFRRHGRADDRRGRAAARQHLRHLLEQPPRVSGAGRDPDRALARGPARAVRRAGRRRRADDGRRAAADRHPGLRPHPRRSRGRPARPPVGQGQRVRGLAREGRPPPPTRWRAA